MKSTKMIKRGYQTVASSAMNSSSKTIELRSDTFTLPSDAMRQAMVSCALGDDVFGDEDDFEDTKEHRFIKEEEKQMECVYNEKFKLWVPSRLI